MWYFSQRGAIWHDNGPKSGSYSGHGEGLNNHAMEAVHGVGPIPVGRYAIGPWEAQHGRLGRIVAALTPVGHDAHGRSGFFWHGDNAEMNNTASDGCIVSPYATRMKGIQSADDELEVVL